MSSKETLMTSTVARLADPFHQGVHVCNCTCAGELAQMVKRPLRMREVSGSIPGFSTFFFSHIIDDRKLSYH